MKPRFNREIAFKNLPVTFWLKPLYFQSNLRPINGTAMNESCISKKIGSIHGRLALANGLLKAIKWL